MKANKELAKWDYLHRLDATMDILSAGLSAGMKTSGDLEVKRKEIIGTLSEFHEREYIEGLVQDIYPEVAEALFKPKHINSVIKFAYALKGYCNDLNDHIAAGKPIIYSFPVLPPELYFGMDLKFIVPFEAVAGLLSGLYMSGVEDTADAAEKDGFKEHICTFTKGPIKAMEMGLLPKPDVLIKNGSPCDSSNLNYLYAADVLDIPLLTVDSPYYTDKRAFKYYKENIREMLVDLEKITGHKMNEEKLRYHAEIANRQLEYLGKLQDMRRHRPCPDPGMLRFVDFASLVFCGHSEDWVEYNKFRYEEVEARHNKGETFLPEGKKEIRTLWTFGWVGNMFYLPDWLEENFASTYMECQLSYLPVATVGHIDTTNFETMLDGLSWKSFCFPMHRTAMSFSDVWVNDFYEIAKSHKVDVALFGGNRACKHAWSLSKILSDELLENLGIPSLIYEMDACDKRFAPHASIKETISEFFNSIAV